MSGYALRLRFYCSWRRRKPLSASGPVARLGVLITASALAGMFSLDTHAQQPDPARASVVVQPGAPGKPSKMLPSSTRAMLPPLSHADVEFMQGMIMHHSQAVEMTAL